MIIGIDDGFYNCKAYGDNGQEFSMVSVPSLVKKSSNSISKTNRGSPIFEIDGVKYATGDVKSDCKRSISMEYGASPENLAVVHNALHRLGMSGKDVAISTGLPFKYYYTHNGDINEELVSRKKQMFKNPVEDYVGGKQPVNIIKHNVMAQGVAAYYDLFIELEYKRHSSGFQLIGNTNNEIMDSNVLILDIGGGNTNPVFIGKGGILDHSRSGTFAHAGYKMISEMEDMVKSDFGMNTELGRDRYEQAIITGQLTINARHKLDVVAIRDELVERHFEIIYEKILSIVDSVHDVDMVVPVGGTTLFFSNEIKQRMQNNFIVDVNLPIFANTRGMYKRLFHINDSKK